MSLRTLPRQQAGMVTAETAVTIPAVLAVAAVLVAVLAVVSLRAQTCAVAGQVGRAQVVGEAYPPVSGYLVENQMLPGGYLQTRATLQHRFANWLPVQCELVLRLERR